MKVYSDILTATDLHAATPRGVTVWECDPISKPRIRSHGWTVQLRCWGSARHVNTGYYGAGEQGAASWDQHGEWMARLFDIDPDARIAYYNGAEDFHRSTRDKYTKVPA